MRTKAGELRDMSVSIRVIELSGHTLFHSVFRDITERKRMERKLRQAERLASLGTFAAGIAHEVNNPLAAIQMTARHALRCLREDKPVKPYLREILGDLSRCTQIVKDVLQFAKQDVVAQTRVDLTHVVRTACDVSRKHAQRRGVSLTLRISQKLPKVLADRTPLERAVVNLVDNAVRASAAGKTVAVALEAQRGGVFIRVIDHGRGMNTEELEHAFEPFFSTFDEEGGTGLGLSMTHGIVTAHGGTLHLDSRPGEGTTATIRLPQSPFAEREGEP
jgi:signal transduction histidine kinase